MSPVEDRLYCHDHFKQLFSANQHDFLTGKEGANQHMASGKPVVNCAVAGCDKPRVKANYCADHLGEVNTLSEAVVAAPSKLGGDGSKCANCQKTAYSNESMRSGVKNYVYHKACFVCFHCGSKLTFKSMCPVEEKLYCNDHYKALLGRKGDYDAIAYEADKATTGH